MKFYLDSTTGTVEQVDDSMTLLSGNDEKGVFNWIEVFDKQQLATARREGWEQGITEAAEIARHYLGHDDVALDIIGDIAAMEYKEKAND